MICHWKLLEQGNVTETAQKENVGHILSVVLKRCQTRVNGQSHNFLKWLDVHYILEWFFGIFFHYLLPPSEVISAFLFLRNTNQFWVGRSKCDVCRAPHHWEMGKTWQNKCFKRKTLKCPQSLRECCAMKAVSTFLDKSCQKCWFSAKFWIWALVAAFFPFEMFIGAIKIKHEPFELDLGPLVLTAKCANSTNFP